MFIQHGSASTNLSQGIC